MAELTEELLEANPDDEEIVDAVGDILVFFADYCWRYGLSYEKAAARREYVELHTPCESIEDLCVEVTISRGNQAYSYLKQDQEIRQERDDVGTAADIASFAHTLRALEEFAEHNGFTLDDAVDEAWGEVKDRDWDSSYN